VLLEEAAAVAEVEAVADEVAVVEAVERPVVPRLEEEERELAPERPDPVVAALGPVVDEVALVLGPPSVATVVPVVAPEESELVELSPVEDPLLAETD